MQRCFSCFLGLLVLLGCIHLIRPDAAFSETCTKWVAKSVSVQGTVEVQKAGESQWQPVALHDTFCPNDVIQTQADSRASFALVSRFLNYTLDRVSNPVRNTSKSK